MAARMLRLSLGFFTSLLIGSLLLLLLTSDVFQTSKHSLSELNNNDKITTFAAARVDPVVSKIAIPFGIKASLRENSQQFRSENISHAKRDEWSDAVAAGQRLYQIMLSGRTLPSLSQDMKWLTGVYPDGSHNSVGWSVYDNAPPRGAPSNDGSSDGEDDDTPVNGTPFGYEVPFNALGIPLGEDNQNWFARQDRDFANCYGFDKQATGAEFDNYCNVPGRTIVASVNFSPAYKLKSIYAQHNRPLTPGWEHDLPFVSRLSDVLWLVWADVCRRAGTSPGDLKYVFRHNVVTPATTNIMEIAVNDHYATWPGTKFTPSDPQYMALLSTPHGKGVFNLVTQHSHALGSRHIESITVFQTEVAVSGNELEDVIEQHMLFTLSG